ncbi:MAG: phosphotransferase family protein [Anaerolineae bacterium]|jgi:aminoglycoside phosphotransferase (APT) family kinase protein
MLDPFRDPPTWDAVTALLDVIAPGSAVLTIDPVPGLFRSATHRVDARMANGRILHIAIRRYAENSEHDPRERAVRQFRILTLMHEHGIPVVRPLYLDDEGSLLGAPGIATMRAPGQPNLLPEDPPAWAEAMGRMLARIHRVPCDETIRDTLPYANAESTRFLHVDALPEELAAHPDGPLVWQTVRDLLPTQAQAPSAITHMNYWPGNVYWDDDGEISAVVDWEEVSYGDPGIDVAHCRMALSLTGRSQSADEFLAAYEDEAGHPVVNLGLWELAAAAGAMPNLTWGMDEVQRQRELVPHMTMTPESVCEAFRHFIAGAMRRAGF